MSYGSGAYGGVDEEVSSSATISNVSPAEGSTLDPLDSISFDVETDGTASVFVRYADGVEETVFDGEEESFLGYFNNPRCTRTEIEGGWTFSIWRAGGWFRAPTVIARVLVG